MRYKRGLAGWAAADLLTNLARSTMHHAAIARSGAISHLEVRFRV